MKTVLTIMILSITAFIKTSAQSLSVKIGVQEWTIKNLDVDHYSNGDAIPHVQDAEQWAQLKTGAWRYYHDTPELGIQYGKLYNWYAVNDPRGLAPVGWHVPSKIEWEQLINSLGGEQEAAAKMKNSKGWEQKDDFNTEGNPEFNGNNQSGFSALPAGVCNGEGLDSFIEVDAEWWSSTDWSSTNSPKYWAWSVRVYYDPNSNVSVSGNLNKEYGLSVRCIKNK